jgi:hypothetical protein
MVIGNFSLLAGIHPQKLHQWYSRQNRCRIGGMSYRFCYQLAQPQAAELFINKENKESDP